MYASGETLHYRDIWFVMKHAGYHARAESVYYGLRRARQRKLVSRTWNGDWHRPDRSDFSLERLGWLLGTGRKGTREILERATHQAHTGLAELHRRRLS